MNDFKRLLRLARPHVPKFLLATIFMIVVGGATAALAFLVKPALDEIFFNRNADMLYVIPIAIIVLYLFKGISTYAQMVLMNYIGQRIVTDLRNELYNHIQRQSLSFFNRNKTGILMARITNDVNLILGAVSEAVTSLCKDTFTLVGLVFVIFYRDWKLAIIAMFVFPLTIYPIAKFGSWMRNVATSTQITMGTLTSLLHETISGARIVKAFCMEEYEGKRFAGENEELFRLFMRTASIRAMSGPFMEFLGGVGIAAIILYGGYQVVQGTSTPGTFFSFLTALIMLYEPVKRLTHVNNTIQQGLAGAVRVFSIMDEAPEIQSKPDALSLPVISRGIDVRDVTFSYDDESVLKDINLSITAGEVVAFVGMSGSGKTTLVNLIPRFYDVDSGSVRIDGVDVRDVTLESLRQQIALVSQHTVLFNDSVRNNIAYGDITKSDDEIIRAAKSANANGFISRMPHGYETVIGDQGLRLSGGERQRVSIARALLKDAPILILDEATSSLDTESEMEVQGALENLMKGRTTFVIAHRLSTIINADKIVVLARGRIVEEGTHESLLARRGEYHKLYTMQFKNNHGAETAGNHTSFGG